MKTPPPNAKINTYTNGTSHLQKTLPNDGKIMTKIDQNPQKMQVSLKPHTPIDAFEAHLVQFPKKLPQLFQRTAPTRRSPGAAIADARVFDATLGEGTSRRKVVQKVQNKTTLLGDGGG